jgi:hypothetical protein
VRSLLPGAGDDGPSPGAVCFLQGGVVHFLQALWLAAPGVEPPHAFCGMVVSGQEACRQATQKVLRLASVAVGLVRLVAAEREGAQPGC